MNLFSESPALIAELRAFEDYLTARFRGGRSRYEMAASERLILAGGKRLRPAMCIAAAMMGRYEREAAFPMAGAIELTHTASLVHDDVIDQAETRRGVPTVSKTDGAHVAVYVGDYLLSSAMLLLSELPQGRRAAQAIEQLPMKMLSRAARSMCSGEIEQYAARFQLPSANRYLNRVMRKTALLFSAACASGAWAGGCDAKTTRSLQKFGFDFGVGFQIRDDILDLTSSQAREGKPVDADLKTGIATLPLLLAAQSDAGVRRAILMAFSGDESSEAATALAIRAGGIEKAQAVLEKYRARSLAALSPLPSGDAKRALEGIIAIL